jgi:putative transposase
VVASGVTATGDREVLGVEIGDTEDQAFWASFFKGLRSRGLAGVQLVISDHRLGLKAAIETVSGRRQLAALPGALHAQRPVPGAEGLGGDGRRRYPHDPSLNPDAVHVRSQLEITTMLAGQFPDVADMLVDAIENVLAFAQFPQAPLEEKIWSTNPLERLNGGIKRRTNVVGAFPNDAAARVVTAVVVETHDEWAVAERRYLSEEFMAKLCTEPFTDPPDEEQPLAITA